MAQSSYGPSPLDETAVTLIALPALYYLTRSGDWTIAVYCGYIFCLLVGPLAHNYGGVPQPISSIKAAVLDLKLPFVVLAASFAFSATRDVKKIFTSMYLVFMGFAFLNIPFVFYDLAAGHTIFDRELASKGSYLQPLALCGSAAELAWLNCLACFGALARGAERRNVWYTVSAILFALMVVITASIKEIAALVLGAYLITQHRQGGLFKNMLLLGAAAAVLIPLFAFTGVGESMLGHLNMFVGADAIPTVRAGMMNASFQIGIDHFPFGTGGGTFGSAPSYQDGYSNVYYAYGISMLNGGGPTFAAFLQDVFWAKIIGEAGFLGAICYVIYIATFALRCYRAMRYSGGRADVATRYSLAVQVMLFLVSLASSPYTNELLLVVAGVTMAYGARSEALYVPAPRSRYIAPSPRPFVSPHAKLPK
ncbi:hypothetical protein FHS83_001681 [Rhizomicrobium palustre]|uniref:Uncharacterized protein n=1 Tax=Rhizomicrobium palustre TaxID=189966 RepID=A0A846MYJ1_9PROT|nr:hypothetical protein [Rhizomicrobium palustre]NIK88363.1 hypothetical protein [Rhizomicrobium palustre]